MTVVLLILKIIGIVLLSLLGLAILALLSVFLVPVRYRISGEVEEEWELSVKLKVSWLFHIVSFRAAYQEGEFQQKIKIFGILLDLDKSAEDSGTEKKKRKRKNSGAGKKKQKRKDFGTEKKKRKPGDTGIEKQERPEDSGAGKKLNENNLAREQTEHAGAVERGRDQEQTETAKSPEGLPGGEAAVVEEIGSSEQRTVRGKRKALFGKIQNFFRKIKAFPGMIKAKWEILKGKVRDFRGLAERIRKEWQDETNRSALKLLWRELRLLLKHFHPRKIKVDAAFSTGEPDTTGQALGAISLIPAVYRYQIHLVPDFEADRFYFRGTFDIRGHVRGVHTIILLYHLIKDKNIRSIIQRYRNS